MPHEILISDWLSDELPCTSHPTRADVCMKDLGQMDYESAQKACLGTGGTFATILTAEDKSFITSTFSGNKLELTTFSEDILEFDKIRRAAEFLDESFRRKQSSSLQ